ncbi:GNAT family N-acetyltransferase [Paucisalibacillus globulus]|uniref:GNAT family N-acetyltransferase n=1 Tax=Paucisalibacillus globulus TaxID=351095 RepID=UPI000BB8F14B|nr:GNAT family N-acetyltransferase [Paucisalibacillus globulus]
MKWYCKKFDELTNHELYAILKARTDVFVVEQNCVYPELDDLDQESIHYFATLNNEIVSYVRILPKGLKYEDSAAIGRVLVVKKFRSNGYAEEIMKKAIDIIRNEWEVSSIKIQAQSYLKNFYRSLGFIQISEDYLEDGIPHIDMKIG